MAVSADVLDDFARRMGMTSSAAEDLLRSLRNASNGSDRLSSAFDVTRQAGDQLSASQREATSKLGNFGKTLQEVGVQIITLPGQISGANGQIFSAVTPALNALSNLSNTLDIPGLAGSISSSITTVLSRNPAFAKVAEVITSKITSGGMAAVRGVIQVTNFMLAGAEEIIQSYFKMSQAGITFGGSLANLNKLVEDSSFSFQTLTKIATTNATNLAMLGGTVEGGLRTVVNVSKNMSNELITVYGGFENLSTEISDYLTLRRLQGLDERKNSQNLIQDTSNYLYNLKLLTTITGKTSKALNDDLAQKTKSAAVQQMLNDMAPAQRDNFLKQIQLMDDATAAAYQDFITSEHYGMVMSKATTSFTTIVPGLLDNFARLRDASLLQSEASNTATAEIYADISKRGKETRKDIGFLLAGAESGRISASVITDANKFLTTLGQSGTYAETLPESLKMATESMKLLKSGSEQVKTLTDTVGGILKSQQALQTEINKIFLGPTKDETGKKIEGGRLALVGVISQGITDVFINLFKKINEGINTTQDIINWLQNFTLSKTQPEAVTADNRLAALERALNEDKANLAVLERQTRPADPNNPTQKQINALKERISTQEQQLKIEREKLNKVSAADINGISATTNASIAQTATDSATDVSTALTNLGTNEKPLIIDWQKFTDNFEPYFIRQEQAIDELSRSLENQASQLKRVMDRVG